MYVTATQCFHCGNRRGQAHTGTCPTLGTTRRSIHTHSLSPSPLVRRIYRKRTERYGVACFVIGAVAAGMATVDPAHESIYGLLALGAILAGAIIFGGSGT